MASPTQNAAQGPIATSTPAFPPSGPTISNAATDDASAHRPRDARLIHLILSSLGIHSYQERVPLQLLDFAYRYTSSILSDSARLASEGYTTATNPNTAASKREAAAGGGDGSGAHITVNALRQAIASRQEYHFRGPLPKEFLLEQAAERNRAVLPRIEKSWGVHLPPERYCLTGVNWGLKEEWDSDELDEDDMMEDLAVKKSGKDVDAEEKHEEQEEEGGSYEDVFGGGDGDREMADA